jgi:hypothetical protein
VTATDVVWVGIDAGTASHQRKRDENKIHTQALLALARRLVDILWALLRDNRVYSPVPPSQVIATAA